MPNLCPDIYYPGGVHTLPYLEMYVCAIDYCMPVLRRAAARQPAGLRGAWTTVKHAAGGRLGPPGAEHRAGYEPRARGPWQCVAGIGNLQHVGRHSEARGYGMLKGLASCRCCAQLGKQWHRTAVFNRTGLLYHHTINKMYGSYLVFQLGFCYIAKYVACFSAVFPE
jgi:hypothetical protein